jgi:putative component of toxin-antitoxin plasmid stabilization module
LIDRKILYYAKENGEDAGNIVIILCGGDKDSQNRDIETAKTYWEEYKHHASIPHS